MLATLVAEVTSPVKFVLIVCFLMGASGVEFGSSKLFHHFETGARVRRWVCDGNLLDVD